MKLLGFFFFYYKYFDQPSAFWEQIFLHLYLSFIWKWIEKNVWFSFELKFSINNFYESLRLRVTYARWKQTNFILAFLLIFFFLNLFFLEGVKEICAENALPEILKGRFELMSERNIVLAYLANYQKTMRIFFALFFSSF